MPRPPGEHARAQAHGLAARGIGLIGVAGLAPVLALAAGAGLPVVLALLAAGVGAMLAIDRWLGARVERRARGAAAEERVGARVDALPGWVALHDIATGRGNIDHVLVGPGGLYTVETKRCEGRVTVTRVDERWLRQAYAEAKHLERVSGRPVTPLLVLAGAWTDAWCRKVRGVWVVSDRMLPRFLAGAPRRLAPEEIAALHARLIVALG